MKITILVACFIGVAVNAAVPGEIGVPGVCVYPSQKDYRCNWNEKLTPAEEEAIVAEIEAQQEEAKSWIKARDVDAMLNTYTVDAKYIYGDLVMTGHAEIRPFLEEKMGALSDRVLTRSNMIIQVLSRRHAMLVYGEFSFPDGFHGRYLCADYYKQDDGIWRHTFSSIRPLS